MDRNFTGICLHLTVILFTNNLGKNGKSQKWNMIMGHFQYELSCTTEISQFWLFIKRFQRNRIEVIIKHLKLHYELFQFNEKTFHQNIFCPIQDSQWIFQHCFLVDWDTELAVLTTDTNCQCLVIWLIRCLVIICNNRIH